MIEAQPFFIVKVNGFWGAIDSNGKIVIKPLFHDLSKICGDRNQYFMGYNNDTIVIYNSQLQADTFTKMFIVYLGNNLFRFLLLSDSSYGLKTLNNNIKFHDSLIINHLVGLMNSYGNVIVYPKFKKIDYFKEGLARASCIIKDNYGYKTEKYGIIDTLGNWVIQPNYVELSRDEWGVQLDHKNEIILFKNGGWGAMDTKGKVILQPKYTSLEICNNNYLIYSTHKWNTSNGLITKDEKIIFKDNGRRSIYYCPCCKNDTILVISRIKWITSYFPEEWNSRLYALSGRKIYNSKYDNILSQCFGKFLVSDNFYWLIDTKGHKLTPDSLIFLKVDYPMIQVKKNNLIGYLDYNSGKIVIQCKYIEAGLFNNGLAPVYTGFSTEFYYKRSKKDVRLGYINIRGEMIWPYTR